MWDPVVVLDGQGRFGSMKVGIHVWQVKACPARSDERAEGRNSDQPIVEAGSSQSFSSYSDRGLDRVGWRRRYA